MKYLCLLGLLALTACKTGFGITVVGSTPVKISVPIPGTSPLLLTCSTNTFVCEGDMVVGGQVVHITASKAVRVVH